MLDKNSSKDMPSDAAYCPDCGGSQKESSGVSSTILFTFIVIYSVISIIGALRGEPFNLNYSVELFNVLMIVRLLSFLLIPFAFKKLKYKLIALVIMLPPLVWLGLGYF